MYACLEIYTMDHSTCSDAILQIREVQTRGRAGFATRDGGSGTYVRRNTPVPNLYLLLPVACLSKDIAADQEYE